MRRHGTLRRYNEGKCRCDLCCDAKSVYTANRKRKIAYGQWEPYTDAELIRAHVTDLVARGMAYSHIAALAGVSKECVTTLVYGSARRGRPPSSRLLSDRAAAILAVTFDLDALPDRARVDATGTRRRAQALAVLGHSIKWQAGQLGRSCSNYHDVTEASKVFVITARQVRDLYAEWAMRPPPESHGAKVARTYALRKGWVSPFAWDDIDDPAAKPVGVA
jgi:hypothetical protein